VGSACFDPDSALVGRAMPSEASLREEVFNWLRTFEESGDFIVLDEEHLIRDEYDRNMRFNSEMAAQEYGLQLLQWKMDRDLVLYVPINEVREANGERIAVLSGELEVIVTDREDRKWVAAALSALDLSGTGCPIVYGAESDWYIIEDALQSYGVVFNRLLPEAWYQARMGR